MTALVISCNCTVAVRAVWPGDHADGVDGAAVGLGVGVGKMGLILQLSKSLVDPNHSLWLWVGLTHRIKQY